MLSLWGITCSQVFHYYTTRPKDSIWIKWMVGLTWVFDTVHQVLIYTGRALFWQADVWVWSNKRTNLAQYMSYV
jgi:hypothetical protein